MGMETTLETSLCLILFWGLIWSFMASCWSFMILDNCCIEILIAKGPSIPSPYFPHPIKLFLNKDFDVIEKSSDLVYDVKSLLIPQPHPNFY